MGMSEFYGSRDDAASLRVLLSAFEKGYRHFDTADFYGQGHNEELLGRFVRELGSRREQICLASKCGLRRTTGGIEVDSTPGYVIDACERSLQRLGVDCIDLYYLHRRSPDVPIEETMGGMARLVAEGKCRHLGLSEVSETTLRRAHSSHPVAALQSEYSLWSRDLEAGNLQAASELGIAIVAYSPLGRGFLGGELNAEKLKQPGDIRAMLPRFANGNFEQNQALLSALEAMAKRLDVPAARLALAWVLARGPHVYVIPGTRSESHLLGNAAAERLALSAEQVSELDAAFAPHAVHGARYPEPLLRTVNV